MATILLYAYNIVSYLAAGTLLILIAIAAISFTYSVVKQIIPVVKQKYLSRISGRFTKTSAS